MKRNNKIRSGVFIAILFTGLFFTGCEEFLDVEDLNHVTTLDTQTPDGLRMLDIGLFANFKGDYNYFWPLYYAHCAGEYEFIEPTGEGPDHYQMWSLNYSSTNNFIIWLYAGCYQAIGTANRIIEYIENHEGTVDEMPQGERERILGTAYFMRGFMYFKLLHLWGKPYDESDKWGVVVYTNVVTNRDSTQKARAKVGEVYALIESDFTKAKNYLWTPAELATVTPSELGRPTKAAASAWLGKIYLFQNKYAQAIAEFQDFENNYLKVTGDNHKGLLDYYGDNFHLEYENGIESLFEVQWGDLTTTSMWGGGGGASNFQIYVGGPGMGRGNVNLRPDIFNEDHGPYFTKFEPYDIRKIESRFSDETDSIVLNGTKIYVRDSVRIGVNLPGVMIPYEKGTRCTYTPKKYINRFNPPSMAPDVNDENQIITRVAEVYFLYAEALIEGNGDLSVAREYLNKITRRAYGYNEDVPCPYDIAYSDAASLRNHLRADKRKEFIGEMIRWHDMIRWDGTYGYSIEQECAITERVYTTKASVWPIPLRDISTNLLLEQYPGY